ncbi:ATP-binding protein [Propionivibrio sp.]|uniref:ATP-binding protein n=1 Tax=Propionivibrio sp. TaxID=2212460 RepID=UPI002628AE06|nr:ATP-binding protein [Propionivibrio sp.]
METLLDQNFAASTGVLAAVRAAVRAACQHAGNSEQCGEQVVLAINEACMNVIQHAYRFADGQHFTLRLAVDDAVLVAHLLDNGLPVSDVDLRPRELDELRPGGLGVRFMRELMDSVAYIEAPQGFTNCLQLTKRIY